MTYLFFGDSLVHGLGDPFCRGWVGRVCENILRENPYAACYNLGVPGNTTVDVKARFLPELERRERRDPDIRIILSTGVNDAVRVQSEGPQAMSESLRAYGELLHQAASLYSLCLVSPLPVESEEINDIISTLGIRYSEIAVQFGIPYLDIFTPLRKSEEYRRDILGDGAHPGAAGYDIIAQLVEDWGKLGSCKD